MISQLLDHLKNWTEAYVWAPLAILSILGAGKIVYWITGREPAENIDWLVDYSSKAVLCVLIILFTSVGKQAFGTWLTKEEKIANPWAHLISTTATLGLAGLVTYIFLH